MKQGDLVYTPVNYMRYETTLKDAYKFMLVQGSKFVVIKKGSREVGLIGEQLLKESLGIQSGFYN